MNSIRQRLLLWLIAGMLAGAAVAGVSMYKLAQDETNELFDYQIKQIALSLPGTPNSSVITSFDEDPEEDNVIQVWDEQGTLLFASHPSRALQRYDKSGVYTESIKHKSWRIYSTRRNGTYIQVAQPMTVREELAAGLALRMLIPFFVLIPLLAGLIWWVVGRSLQPLQRVTSAVATRHADAMQALDETGLPEELLPVVVALNQLLQRLDQAMQGKSAFIADAAHELRSPLTALKLQLQLTERATNDEQRSIAFAKLNQRLDRSIHLVRQLLTLARSESGLQPAELVMLDLGEIAEEVVRDFTPLAAARQINLQFNNQPGSLVAGQRENLIVMMNNLVDNAIRYTPPFGWVCVEVGREAEHGFLRVTDSGIGIPEAERERVFDRFYRREGMEVTGSGIGLAIVRNIVEIHHASIALTDNSAGSGLSVTVSFPQGSTDLIKHV